MGCFCISSETGRGNEDIFFIINSRHGELISGRTLLILAKICLEDRTDISQEASESPLDPLKITKLFILDLFRYLSRIQCRG